MKVTVDLEACISAGQCVMAADQVFDQRDEDGVVVLLQAEPPADQEDAVRQAALMCPTGAITISDD